jgi:DNA-binding beta-propeller fold protein YncE
MYRSLFAACVLLLLCTALFASLGVPSDPPPVQFSRAGTKGQLKTSALPRLLPGVQSDAAILLPNQWSIRPAGKQLQLGDYPVNMVLHPSGQYLAILHAGFTDHEIIIVDLNPKKQKITCRVILDQTFYGICFSPDGKQLFVSGGEFEVVHAFRFQRGLLSQPEQIAVANPTDKFVVGGLAVDPAGRTLFAAGTFGHAVAVVPLDNPGNRTTISFVKESYPYACLVDPAGKMLYVSLWNKAAVAVIDLKTKKMVRKLKTELHPTEMIFSGNGKLLYVACANSTKVSVLDVTTGQGVSTIACSLYPIPLVGNTPCSLCLIPDSHLLFVCNADANNVAVFNVANPAKPDPLGFIPAGWYPTAVRYNPVDQRLYIANARGTSTRANPQGPRPTAPKNQTIQQYIGALYRGTLSILDMPTAEKMADYTKLAYKCSPLRSDQGVIAKPDGANSIPVKVGKPSPIKHCIYIIRENRTYDQVFGDMKEGNGDPSLCLFPEKITPNAHRLARQFVLLDNFYVEAEVSADGHQWAMGAYCTDFVKKLWPLSYRGSPLKKLNLYPSEGNFDEIARPAGGYIWDRCAEAKVSYRSYGEWIENGKTPKEPGKASVKALEGHFDPWFRGYDLDYPDAKRTDRFIEELKRFEKEGEMPSLIIMRLPNDHTFGTKVGKPTPTAMVAENDLALGRLVEAVSKSSFWKTTALFIVEDDAQNGSDHVDAHRTVALVISPYTKHGYVDSSMYSTASMLRTMELILGLRPMSQFDAAARPMYASFQDKPDLTPYQHVLPDTDLKAINEKTAWGADLSEKMDFSTEDAADDLLLNEVIWRSVRGPDSPMPPPVRSAFVFRKLKQETEK